MERRRTITTGDQVRFQNGYLTMDLPADPKTGEKQIFVFHPEDRTFGNHQGKLDSTQLAASTLDQATTFVSALFQQEDARTKKANTQPTPVLTQALNSLTGLITQEQSKNNPNDAMLNSVFKRLQNAGISVETPR